MAKAFQSFGFNVARQVMAEYGRSALECGDPKCLMASAMIVFNILPTDVEYLRGLDAENDDHFGLDHLDQPFYPVFWMVTPNRVRPSFPHPASRFSVIPISRNRTINHSM